MVPPLRWVLEKLCKTPQGAEFGDLSPQFDEEAYVPRLEPLSGLQILPVPSNTFPPEKRTNAFLLGDNHSPQILVDPSPESPEVLTKLLRTLRQDKIDALFLTHHHADHHEHAPELAKNLGVPICMSEDTLSRIKTKMGASYFAGLKVTIIKAGDTLTTWKSEAVRTFQVPGHDAGQLALAPESLRWFIVGDLIQSVGTVVIAAPEGDMKTYFETLEKIIALAPAVIVPSHGTPLRSTFRIKATLQHRREREQAILNLYAAGKTETEMLEIIYQDVDQKLRPYALKSLKAHLVKLQQEGRISPAG
jgi:glyoxylase-like metal-dependent hydrolase (beta-lactamase superfamily II)